MNGRVNLRQSFFLQSRQAWNSLYSPGWPQSFHISLPRAGITGKDHNPSFFLLSSPSIHAANSLSSLLYASIVLGPKDTDRSREPMGRERQITMGFINSTTVSLSQLTGSAYGGLRGPIGPALLPHLLDVKTLAYS